VGPRNHRTEPAFTGWEILLGVVPAGVLLWIGLYWRPSKACGRNIVMTVVLVRALSALAVVVLASMDVLPYLGQGEGPGPAVRRRICDTGRVEHG
jgi:hypothetical protein